MLKPIETLYKGYRFRSRLEARWAVFFDALGWKWEYEKEGYEFADGTRYLPDFWLPSPTTVWVEVKGQVCDNDWHKADLLAKESGYPVIMVFGFDSLPIERSPILFIHPPWKCLIGPFGNPQMHDNRHTAHTGTSFLNVCRHVFIPEHFATSIDRLEYLSRAGALEEYAIDCARQARLEYGENGKRMP